MSADVKSGEDDDHEALPVKFGKDEELEAQADKLLAESVGANDRSVDRDFEKLAYEFGLVAADDLQQYDPTNDWDTQDGPWLILVQPANIPYLTPSICSADDGNIRERNREAYERQALMRHLDDVAEWKVVAEQIPLLGANDGPRKTCTKCKRPKGLQYFSPKADAKDGLHPWCKECRRLAVSQKRDSRR